MLKNQDCGASDKSFQNVIEIASKEQAVTRVCFFFGSVIKKVMLYKHFTFSFKKKKNVQIEQHFIPTPH